MPVTLTPKQAAAMRFLQATIDGSGTSPTLAEICGHIGLKSKSGAHRLLEGLEKRGYIRRRPSAARAIEILHRVVDAPPPGGPPICPHCLRPMTSH